METFEQVLDAMYGIGTRIIWLGGGEPLLNPHIDEMVSHVKARKMVCEITTNGWFAEQKMDTLLKTDSVCFSVDGDEEAHDSARGPGSHQRLVRAMRLGRERSLRFRINCVLARHNLSRETVDKMCELAREVDTLVTFPLVMMTVKHDRDGRATGAADLDIDRYRDILRYLIQKKKEGEPVRNSFGSLHKMLAWPLGYQDIVDRACAPPGTAECLYGRLVAYLDSDGTLYPCTRLFGCQDKGANVYELGPKEAWKKVSKLDCYACARLTDMHRTLTLNPADVARHFVRLVRR
jgi:MoaA/NifB/PqqE/SkfB family radical SAM enzyme